MINHASYIAINIWPSLIKCNEKHDLRAWCVEYQCKSQIMHNIQNQQIELQNIILELNLLILPRYNLVVGCMANNISPRTYMTVKLSQPKTTKFIDCVSYRISNISLKKTARI